MTGGRAASTIERATSGIFLFGDRLSVTGRLEGRLVWIACWVRGFLFNWQTLIAGLCAVGAAVVTVRWSEGYSRRRERAETDAMKASLGVEIKAFLNVLLQAHSVLLKVDELEHVSTKDIGKATRLPEPVVYPAAADRIGRLGLLAPSVTSFYVALKCEDLRPKVGVALVGR